MSPQTKSNPTEKRRLILVSFECHEALKKRLKVQTIA